MSRKWLGGMVVGIRLREGEPWALLEGAPRERSLCLGAGGGLRGRWDKLEGHIDLADHGL